jgi:hypothetical protein
MDSKQIQALSRSDTVEIAPAHPDNPATFEAYRDAVTRACYRAILGREPEDAILERMTSTPVPETWERELTDTIQRIYSSPEARDRTRRILRSEIKSPYGRIPDRVVCFIHLEKTGGTTLDAELEKRFGNPDRIGRGANRLYTYATGEFAGVRYIGGHMDYSETEHLPYKQVFRLALFRSPVDRLVSFYRYHRAHVPEFRAKNIFVDWAHAYTAEEFFSLAPVRSSPRIDNAYLHTFGATTVGARVAPGPAREAAFRLAWDRIARLEAVGLTDMMDESVAVIFRELNMAAPSEIETRNNAESFGKANADLVATPKVELTPALREALGDLVAHDEKLFEVARARFNELCAALAAPAGGPA